MADGGVRAESHLRSPALVMAASARRAPLPYICQTQLRGSGVIIPPEPHTPPRRHNWGFIRDPQECPFDWVRVYACMLRFSIPNTPGTSDHLAGTAGPSAEASTRRKARLPQAQAKASILCFSRPGPLEFGEDDGLGSVHLRTEEMFSVNSSVSPVSL
ncbi:hypothetical protein SRHO_G00087060 [Serrasalmus rhombeus]